MEESMKKLALALALLAPLAVSVPSWALSCATAAACTGGGTQVGSLLSQPTTVNFTATQAPVGTVSSWAFSGDTNNFLHGLTFVYQFTVASDYVDIANFLSFTGFATSDTYGQNGSNVAPIFAMNQNYLFVPGVNFPGQGATSDFLIVYTNAANFGNGTALLQDGGQSQAPALDPTASAPEPASMALFGSGLVGLAGIIRRRRRTSQTA
jgi:hypothetical protein